MNNPDSMAAIIAGEGIEPRQFIEVEAALAIPVYANTPPALNPGIYFGMDEHDYHAMPAFNQSGAKVLRASPTMYWEKSWLNPENKPDAGAEKKHNIVGKGYHAMIMEGRKAFDERFYPLPAKEDHADAIDAAAEIKAEIEKLGQKPATKVDDGKGGSRAAKKEDWVNQLIHANPRAQVWDDIIGRARKRAGKRSLIERDDYIRIHVAHRMIAQQPELAKAFTGGYPEVVLVWLCPKQGVLKKARVDYLKLKAVVDLKSYENRYGRSARSACARTISDFAYFLQPAHYLEGINEVKELVRQSGVSVIHSLDDCGDEAHCVRRDFALRWASYKGDLRWLWVFQQKGAAPITRGLWHPLGGTKHSIAQGIMLDATRQFRQCCETYGTDMWLDIEPVDELDEEEIPNWGYEI
jgi:hypothetical protein